MITEYAGTFQLSLSIFLHCVMHWKPKKNKCCSRFVLPTCRFTLGKLVFIMTLVYRAGLMMRGYQLFSVKHAV